MRLPITLSCAVLAVAAQAQNWALLNPAYKYNYSNDGTDTISNQIFVTHIDTLGPDSFRYELNRIGVVCDTCLASMGGPCDGCFVWADQPQFLQRSVIVSPTGWLFIDPDTFLIRPRVPSGQSWPYHPDGSLSAIASEPIATTFLGVADSIRSIELSNGWTIQLSKLFGLVSFQGSQAAAYSAIGVHGPDLGQLIPEPLDYFDFGPGDILRYDMGQIIASQIPPAVDWQKHWRMTIETRTEVPGGILFTYALEILYFGGVGATTPAWLDQGFSGTWLLMDSSLRAYNPMLASYPGELVDWECAMYPSISYSPFNRKVLAEHSIAPGGHYRVEARRTDQGSWCSDTGRSILTNPNAVQYGLYAFDDVDCVNLWYEQGTGVIMNEDFGFEWSCGLSGRWEGHVGIAPVPRLATSIFPVPADDHIVVGTTTVLPCSYRIFTTDGQLRSIGEIAEHPAHTIDVSSLAPGMYSLALTTATGISSQRFIIAR